MTPESRNNLGLGVTEDWTNLFKFLFCCAELDNEDDLEKKRICRIVTRDFPQYFAVVSRIRQETNQMGPEGGTLNSCSVPLVQASFPEGALTKKIKVGLQVRTRSCLSRKKD